MSLGALAVLLLMGTLAGMINAAVGSGSLLTLPVLLALGVAPGTAVRTNTLGILFSTVGSVAGYRREIAAERAAHRIGPLLATTLVCSALGSCLLLVSPSEALDVVVPVLIVLALVLVVSQKRITRAIAALRERRSARAGVAEGAPGGAEGAREGGAEGARGGVYTSPALLASMGVASMYGGYFTAAQGILYLGVLGAFTGRAMTSINAMKNLLSLLVNATAVAVYLAAHWIWGAPIVWEAAAAIAVGALAGGYGGSHLAKRLPESAMRGVIVVVALVALVRQVL
ncbi:sulfite exporter TauE/SafE family protein [Brachybacterium nesterenkovii]|uniref:Probable membrane transporter protein n=1 Tax=Brachybacterium nesterenkovii TaxID=47847 RepID=A0A1X6WZL9_9MICO|nr:sulfite exporter TauE/SafE family protein [Brachybacterium nesterenkovii]SLM91452.1 membrane protein [Brachybacterium nesterenkovii]